MKLYHLMGAAALMLGAATVATAQDPQGPPPGPPPGHMGMGMGQGGRGGGMGLRGGPPGGPLFKGITLTDAQKDSIRKLDDAQREAMKGMHQPGQRPDSATMARMMAMRVHQQELYRAVLTPDQQKMFDKNMADMREMMQRRMQERQQRQQ